jgi:PPOX class probable F420-dependent enzyme
MAVTDAIYLRMRHRGAWDSAAAEPLPAERGFESLRGHKYCLLTTFRKSGEPVPTPVWFGLADGTVYLRTEAAVGKVKRVRNDPRVRLAPCTLRGKPLGPPAEGAARVLAPGESEPAERAIASNYGLIRKLYEGVSARLLSVEELYIAVEPVDSAGARSPGGAASQGGGPPPS